MTDDSKSPSLLGFLARAIGHRFLPWLIHDDPEQRKAVKRKLAVAAGEGPAVFDTVAPIYERLLGEATSGRPDAPPELQPTWTRGERAVFSTRFVVEEFDSTGPVGLLTKKVRPVLDEALAGFRLFGLDEHTATVVALLASGFDEHSPDADVEDFAEDWYNLEDADPARATYIKSHPEEFRT